MSSVTSDVCKGGSLSALLAFMRLQVPLHSLQSFQRVYRGCYVRTRYLQVSGVNVR
jgi:hypothetical protein